jgi:protoporphyrinogen oxidase
MKKAVREETEVLILGGGLTGLAAASVLGDDSVVIEQESRPGGLVRTECFNGYWFDRVIHILHFKDEVTERKIRELLGDDLAPCPPDAWVETAFGTVRFPFQMHLNGLEKNQIVCCLRDLAEVVSAQKNGNSALPSNFEEMLQQTFGKAMCETFLFPYNRKLWKRPLNTLAPTGFQWTITLPDFEKVLLGAVSSHTDFRAYNANGWYPRPHRDSPKRGMEILSEALAKKASNVRLNHRIETIDLEERTVTVKSNDQTLDFVFREGCCATLPLPKLVKMCKQAPEALRKSLSTLTCNRVLSAALSIRGPRPVNRGHWRYYADESLIFTRLVYMNEFDSDSAPENGWGLLVEITEPAENPLMDTQTILSRVRNDIRRVGALPNDCEIIDEHLMLVDPAYVVFTVDNQAVVEDARDFLKAYGVEPLGRYGKWEYSSMAQVLSDGFSWGEEMAAHLAKRKLRENSNERQNFIDKQSFEAAFS